MAAIKRDDLEGKEEFFIHHSIDVDPGQVAMRIDKFLTLRLEKVSRNRIQEAIKVGSILVNDKAIKSNYKVRPKDNIKVLLPRDPNENREVLPEDIPIDVVYEDDSVLVINKQAGLVVHPGIGNHDGTLVNALAHYFKRDDLPVLPKNPVNRPGLVHRIDKDTTGLMVIAKTEYAMTHLAKQFFDHTVERKYNALVWGNFEEPSGTMTGHIGRNPSDRFQMTVFEDGDFGKHAVTHYKVIKDYYYVSLIECQLETGRTHQIRAHMKYFGHPLFADRKYGGDQIRKGTVYTKYKQFVQNCLALCDRQCLHAGILGFEHPETGEQMRFESPIPEDIQAVLEKWNGYFKSKVKN